MLGCREVKVECIYQLTRPSKVLQGVCKKYKDCKDEVWTFNFYSSLKFMGWVVGGVVLTDINSIKRVKLVKFQNHKTDHADPKV